jgi:Alpha-aminoadipate carrier protein LysW-like, globular domain
MREVSCPICNADVPLDGDEREGETVYCAYCKAPLKVRPPSGQDEVELEEDF